MTDNEIIKALNCCQTGCCGYCPLQEASDCNGYLAQLSLDLIQRQQKHIEQLETLLNDRCDRCIENERESTIRAFAESIIEQLEEAAYETESFEYDAKSFGYEAIKVVDLEDAIGFVKGVK